MASEQELRPKQTNTNMGAFLEARRLHPTRTFFPGQLYEPEVRGAPLFAYLPYPFSCPCALSYLQCVRAWRVVVTISCTHVRWALSRLSELLRARCMQRPLSACARARYGDSALQPAATCAR